MYDHVTVRSGTADENAPSNALIAGGSIIAIHKVTLEHADGSTALSVLISDGPSVGVTALFGLSTNAVGGATLFERYIEANYNPPVRLQSGLSVNLTGTGTWRIFYTL